MTKNSKASKYLEGKFLHMQELKDFKKEEQETIKEVISFFENPSKNEITLNKIFEHLEIDTLKIVLEAIQIHFESNKYRARKNPSILDGERAIYEA